jgi:hypothetical protein
MQETIEGIVKVFERVKMSPVASIGCMCFIIQKLCDAAKIDAERVFVAASETSRDMKVANGR